MMQTPLFVVFEGIDGVGKTTQIRRLTERFQRVGWPVVATKEPSDGPWGRLLRESATTGRLSLEDELNAFIEDRKDHVTRVILPALAQGKIVLCDRYYFSTAAYQGARGLDPDDIIRRNEAFAPEPHVLIWLDLDPKQGLGRVNARGDQANLFEEESQLAKAREIFSKLQRPYRHRLEASESLERVEVAILNIVARELWTRAESLILQEREVPGPEELIAYLASYYQNTKPF